MPTTSIDTLTPREREILTLIAEGDSLAEIAQKLGRSLKTIESHRLSMGRKLKVSNRVELTKIAITSGLISLDTNASDAGMKESQSKIELQWFEQINQAVYNTPGRQYIGALCQAVTRIMGVRFCAVCIPDPKAPKKSRFTVSLAEHGKPLEPISYQAQSTPGEAVVTHGECVVSDAVQTAYPDDELMKALDIKAYVGVRLANALDQSPGILAASHDEPIEHADSIKRVLDFFVPRTSAELVRTAQEKQLQELNQKLQQYAIQSLQTNPSSGDRAYQMDLKNGMERLQLLLSTLSGSRLLDELTNTLCEITGVKFAAICMRDHSEDVPTLVTLTVSESALTSDTLRYALEGTPCKINSEVGEFTLKSGLAEWFPDDVWVVENELSGYVGVRLDDFKGDQLGVMWLVDDKPIEDTEQLLTILQSLSPRVAAEVEDRLRLDELHRRCEALELQVKATSI